MAQESLMYILTMDVNIADQNGLDLPGTLVKLNTLLDSYPTTSKCLYKYKITGEASVVAVFEVSNIIGFERMISGIARLGSVSVTCKPMIWYQRFGKFLNVDANLLTRDNDTLKNDIQLYWLDFQVEYPGKTTSDLLSTWSDEAVAALTSRNTNGSLELFKVIAERKVHAFIAMDAGGLDELSFNLPVMQQNGNGVTIKTKALQSLENYCNRISTDEL